MKLNSEVMRMLMQGSDLLKNADPALFCKFSLRTVALSAILCLLQICALSSTHAAPSPSKVMSESATFLNNEVEEASNQPYVTILQLVEHPALDATRRGLMDELKKAKIEMDYEVAQNNPALAAQIAQKFVSSSPNVMVGIPTLSAQSLLNANRTANIPIVFASVTDPVGSHLVNDLKKPKGNITGVSNYVDPHLQFKFFKRILPTLEKIGVIYNPGEPNSVALNEAMSKAAKEVNVQLIFAPANTTAEVPQATQSLLKKVDAIFINNDNTALSAFESITKIANKNKIPVFVSDTDMISHGAFAALGPNQYEIGRQAAKIILKILSGEKTDAIPVAFPEKVELYLNAKTAALLKITIPDSILNEAVYVVKQ